MNSLWFDFSPSKTHDCESDWLLSTLPYLLTCPEKQDLLSDLRCKYPGWACSSICRKCLFPCCAHRNGQNSCFHWNQLSSNQISCWQSHVWSYYWFVIMMAEGILGGVYYFQFFFFFCYETSFVQPTSSFARVSPPTSLTILFSLNIRHLLLKHPSPWMNLVSKSSLSLLSRNLFWMKGKYYNPDLYCSWTEERYPKRDSLFWFYLNLFGLGYWALLCEGFSVNLQWGFTSPKERIRNLNHCGEYLAFTTVTS